MSEMRKYEEGSAADLYKTAGTGRGEIEKYPNFSLREYFEGLGIQFRVHESGGHTEYAINCTECTNRGEPRPDVKFRLWINSSTGIFHCYNCDWAGDLLHFIQKLSKMNLMDAIKILKGKFLDDMEHLNLRLIDNSEDADGLYDTEIPPIQFPFGYEPLRVQHPYLEHRGIPFEYAQANDWGFSDLGYCRERIIVPTYMQDRLVFWQARTAFDGNGDEKIKKVLNPKGVSSKPILYQYDSAKDFKEVILVEGFMDAAKMGPDSMATNGKRLHPEQVEWMVEAGIESVVLIWDDDAWRLGRQGKPSAVAKAVDLLKTVFKVKTVRMPKDRDPGSYSYLSTELREMILKAQTC